MYEFASFASSFFLISRLLFTVLPCEDAIVEGVDTVVETLKDGGDVDSQYMYAYNKTK